MAIRPLNCWSNRDEWNVGMDVDISTVTEQSARSRTDAHADGSTFVPREATIGRLTTNPQRTFLANALKADRNHRFIRSISFNDRQEFHLMTDKFHFMTDKFHLMTEPTHPSAVGSVIK